MFSEREQKIRKVNASKQEMRASKKIQKQHVQAGSEARRIEKALKPMK